MACKVHNVRFVHSICAINCPADAIRTLSSDPCASKELQQAVYMLGTAFAKVMGSKYTFLYAVYDSNLKNPALPDPKSIHQIMLGDGFNVSNMNKEPCNYEAGSVKADPDLALRQPWNSLYALLPVYFAALPETKQNVGALLQAFLELMPQHIEFKRKGRWLKVPSGLCATI